MKDSCFFASCTALLLGAATLTASAQPLPPVPPGPRGGSNTGAWTPNFKDTDITMIAEAVSAATGKNFIIDPRVRAQVTVLSATPMSPAAFYQMFLSILEVHGFTAEPAGDVIKIVPDANAEQHGMPPDQVGSTSDEFITEVVNVKNVDAAQLVPILRPMVPPYGSLAAYPAANILIISDSSSNLNRLIRIIRGLDQAGDQDLQSAFDKLKAVGDVPGEAGDANRPPN